MQQVGRAGRDGREGRCVLLLDDGDYTLLRALAHGATVLPRSVAAFLGEHVFGGDGGEEGGQQAGQQQQGQGQQQEAEGEWQQGGRCRAAPVKALTAALDAPEEVLEAALSFMQGEERPLLHALPHTAASLEVRFHRCAGSCPSSGGWWAQRTGLVQLAAQLGLRRGRRPERPTRLPAPAARPPPRRFAAG